MLTCQLHCMMEEEANIVMYKDASTDACPSNSIHVCQHLGLWWYECSSRMSAAGCRATHQEHIRMPTIVSQNQCQPSCDHRWLLCLQVTEQLHCTGDGLPKFVDDLIHHVGATHCVLVIGAMAVSALAEDQCTLKESQDQIVVTRWPQHRSFVTPTVSVGLTIHPHRHRPPSRCHQHVHVPSPLLP